MASTGKQRDEIVELLHRIRDKKESASAKPTDLSGTVLANADLQGVDLSDVDLSKADLSGANLTGANLFRANLKEANLHNANLDRAEFSGANLVEAHLEEVSAVNTGLGMACMKGVKMFRAHLEGSTLTKADLRDADLRCAYMRNARIRETDLAGADLTGADLQGADMSLCNVSGAAFKDADLREARLRLISGYKKANWMGADIRNVNFAGAYLMRRFIVDQNYLEEFRRGSRFSAVVYYIWWLTSDCGRSMTRWCVLIVLQMFFFAWLYTLVGVDYGAHPTFLSPLYFSVVTLTTLGFGDIVPASPAAQFIAMIEVCLGYTMLGGLLSIVSNKMARRAE